MSDPRMQALSNFTSTIHHTIPEQLQPDRFVLSSGFTLCIIGASQGIGEHITYSYAKAKVSRLVLAARTAADLQKVAGFVRKLNTNIEIIIETCDIASASSVKDLADSVKSRFQRLDLLICNAAYAGPVTLKIEEGEPEWVQRAFDVNVLGTYHAAHYFVPLLLASQNGAKGFFAIGSLAGSIRRGSIANTGYTVSKMAQTRIVEYLHEQYSVNGLTALTIHPGAVLTNMAKDNTPDDFMPYLIDDVGLCGAICVWLSTRLSELSWLSGRFISANWDMDELLSKRETIIQKDLLKFTMAVD